MHCSIPYQAHKVIVRARGQYECNALTAVQTWDECALARTLTNQYVYHLE
jgi:hypothetical protein